MIGPVMQTSWSVVQFVAFLQQLCNKVQGHHGNHVAFVGEMCDSELLR